ncbi:disease resistance protein RPV1-like [Rhodamnia argentea]|uniref:Disease resistance protein RPV1-like n=1 Tax=Rhodamnia argentea TaxID=178133 RepID=A0A8B8N0A1_9MYRT|nr:disease resistance protein RPV1-like [Rhodamnia argentea]
MAKNLKVLNLTKCRKLRRTPDFSAHKNLEKLILQGCEELVHADRSIGKLKHLVLLNLKGCRKLRRLPDEMGDLGALTEILVDDTSITNIPEWKGMKKLETLSANSCTSLSIFNLAGRVTSLVNIRLVCTRITELPFGNFGALAELDISWSRIRELPNSIEKMKNLRVLRMCHSRLVKLPSALGMLEKLEEINADGCRNLQGEIPSEIGRLSFLRILRLMDARISKVPKLPENLSFLLKLRELVLVGKNLACLPMLPQNLSCLTINGGLMEKSIDLSYLEKLSELEVCDCEHLTEIQGLEHLKNLKRLRLYHLPSLVKLPDLTNLKKLWELWISDCPKLVEIQGQLESLKELRLMFCESLEKLPDSLSFKNMGYLVIDGCPKLKEIQGLEDSENLE